ncbi:unnamed protein product, partial [Nesidiocoris tenuis]
MSIIFAVTPPSPCHKPAASHTTLHFLLPVCPYAYASGQRRWIICNPRSARR